MGRLGSSRTQSSLGLLPNCRRTLADHPWKDQRDEVLVREKDRPPERRNELIGVGIDEATAVWFKADGTWEVLGEGWVQIYGARSAQMKRIPDRDGDLLGGRQIQMHILLPGDRFDPHLNPCPR